MAKKKQELKRGQTEPSRGPAQIERERRLGKLRETDLEFKGVKTTEGLTERGKRRARVISESQDTARGRIVERKTPRLNPENLDQAPTMGRFVKPPLPTKVPTRVEKIGGQLAAVTVGEPDAQQPQVPVETGELPVQTVDQENQKLFTEKFGRDMRTIWDDITSGRILPGGEPISPITQELLTLGTLGVGGAATGARQVIAQAPKTTREVLRITGSLGSTPLKINVPLTKVKGLLNTKPGIQGLSYNPKNVGLFRRFLSGIWSPRTLAILAAAGIASAVSSWFLGLWARAEVPEPINIVQRQALELGIETGNWEQFDNLTEARNEVVSDTTFSRINQWIPVSGAAENIPRKAEGNIRSGVALVAIGEDWKTYQANNESPEERRLRINDEINDATRRRNVEELEIVNIKGEYFRILDEQGRDAATNYLNEKIAELEGG